MPARGEKGKAEALRPLGRLPGTLRSLEEGGEEAVNP
jgi:hypothetical protein